MSPAAHPDFDPDELAPYEAFDGLVSVTPWEPVDLEWVIRGECITPAPTVLTRADGVKLLYPGRVSLFMGESESCKTWIAALGVAEELRAGRHVMVLDYEDSAELLVERLLALGVSAEAVESRLTYVNPAGRFDELAEAALQDAIELRGQLALAVIDGVTEAMGDLGLDPLSGTDVARFYAGPPLWLARTGAAVALLDHVVKSAESRGRWAIGSERKISGLTGAAYSLETVRPFGRGKTGLVKITVAKDRVGYVRKHEGPGKVIALAELKSWPDDGVTISLGLPESTPEAAGFRPTGLMEKVSKVVAQSPGLSKNSLRAVVGGKATFVDLALELLIRDGYVDARPGPRNSQQHFSARPFTPDEGCEEVPGAAA